MMFFMCFYDVSWCELWLWWFVVIICVNSWLSLHNLSDFHPCLSEDEVSHCSAGPHQVFQAEGDQNAALH